MIRGIIIAGDECNGEIYEFETQEEANAFDDGVMIGSNLYGAGGCGFWTRSDLEYLVPEQDKIIIDFINEFLPN